MNDIYEELEKRFNQIGNKKRGFKFSNKSPYFKVFKDFIENELKLKELLHVYHVTRVVAVGYTLYKRNNPDKSFKDFIAENDFYSDKIEDLVR